MSVHALWIVHVAHNLQVEVRGQYRAPNRANTDQPDALDLASTSGRNLGVCACFLGSLLRVDQGLSYEVLWAFWRSFEHVDSIKINCPNTKNLLLAGVKTQKTQLTQKIQIENFWKLSEIFGNRP